jgi:hypothetical protein
MNKKIIFFILLLLVAVFIFFYFNKLKLNQNKVGGCYIENCHGLEIKCGPKKADFCTMEYVLGDNCRQFASCQIKDGQCQPVYQESFNKCKLCVEDCQKKYSDDSIKLFQCEEQCVEK